MWAAMPSSPLWTAVLSSSSLKNQKKKNIWPFFLLISFLTFLVILVCFQCLLLWMAFIGYFAETAVTADLQLAKMQGPRDLEFHAALRKADRTLTQKSSNKDLSAVLKDADARAAVAKAMLGLLVVDDDSVRFSPRGSVVVVQPEAVAMFLHGGDAFAPDEDVVGHRDVLKVDCGMFAMLPAVFAHAVLNGLHPKTAARRAQSVMGALAHAPFAHKERTFERLWLFVCVCVCVSVGGCFLHFLWDTMV
jgi:hypothetical protein